VNPVACLIANYRAFVALPWASNLAGKQRVWLAVYPPPEERRVRANLQEFENATRETGHGWKLVDVTNAMPEWLGSLEERDACFAEPEYLSDTQELEERVVQAIRSSCQAADAKSDAVVCVLGVGSLFDFVRVSHVLEKVEDAIQGRLLVFFPGEHQHNTYRFMDARDGFNYLATPITCAHNPLTQ
jgi:hypothetical protein